MFACPHVMETPKRHTFLQLTVFLRGYWEIRRKTDGCSSYRVRIAKRRQRLVAKNTQKEPSTIHRSTVIAGTLSRFPRRRPNKLHHKGFRAAAHQCRRQQRVHREGSDSSEVHAEAERHCDPKPAAGNHFSDKNCWRNARL